MKADSWRVGKEREAVSLRNRGRLQKRYSATGATVFNYELESHRQHCRWCDDTSPLPLDTFAFPTRSSGVQPLFSLPVWRNQL